MTEQSATFDPESARILAAVDEAFAEARGLAHWMAQHPELALEEREASARYVAWLEARGFAIQRGVGGMETAFLARRGSDRAPLHAVLLAEMDALPGIGHACGHNLSGPASLLAAHALATSLPEELLQLVVAGAPAEEIGVGKRRLVEAGVFREAHVAMMAHASDMRRAHRLFLGNRKFEFVFHGRASHAAAYPEQGLNALDGVIQLFVAIGALRQQLPRTGRIHGIVSDGGRAPNVIPERAAARVWVRALEDETLEATTARVVACARGAAEATGTRLEILHAEAESPAMRPNLTLAGVYRRQLERLGLSETTHAADASIGSSDITHVSQVVPTIHPNFPIARAGERLELHTRAFAEATTGPQGDAGLREAARSLALTIRELARSPSLRAEVAEEHRSPL
jgi:amidohydrolase